MVPTEKPLDNPINWSFRVGRLWAIDIRVHIAFVICAVVLFWMELPEKESLVQPSLVTMLTDAFGTYVMLFFIVLVHEFGHCFGARYCGGDADEILLWPLGGLAYVNPPHQARAHMLTAAAGPTVNIILCAICSAVLTVWSGRLGAVPWNPLHPTLPVESSFLPTTAQSWVLRFYGISYFLLLVNLLPIYPFDGGRMLQAWLWPRKGYGAAMEIATGTGMVGAIVIGLFALFTDQSWLLLMIAAFGYLTCWQTRRMLRETGDMGLCEAGYDFSRGYASLDAAEPRPRRAGFLQRRRLRRAALRAERERQREAEHQQAVEDVLRKVSVSGMVSLTAREMRILEEETFRKRTLGSDFPERKRT